jgi:DNA transformation protein
LQAAGLAGCRPLQGPRGHAPFQEEFKSLVMRTKSDLARYVEEQLAFLGRVSAKAIFGGIGIFVDERLLGIVIEEKLYLHTDASNLSEYQARGMPQFKPYPNAFDLTTDHHQVPPEIVEDPQALKTWGQRALSAAIEAAKVKQLAGIERSRHMKRAKKKQGKDK